MANLIQHLKNSNFFSKREVQGLGLELQPGDDHYRAYVGPPRHYDFISAMVFNLLTSLGLRQNHKVLDVGCGSLRIGRLLIPYLNKNNYYGVEPNSWLVKDGIRHEIGKDLIKIKQPHFSFKSDLEDFKKPLGLDFAFAQSIFSHCGHDLLENWLRDISQHLNSSGVLAATFIIGETDYHGNGWIYPECVEYTPQTVEKIAAKHGLHFDLIDWEHPRQAWALFSKEKFDRTLIDNGPISWNNVAKKE